MIARRIASGNVGHAAANLRQPGIVGCLTDADMPIHAIVVRVFCGLADAASQLRLDVVPAEDEKAFGSVK